MSGERDLSVLLREMTPEANPGAYVFATIAGSIPPGVEPVATIREAEGLTLVIPHEQAESAGLDFDFVAGWITLRIHSALDAVGLTAAIAQVLSAAGISCNVIAGFYHDHLFVPIESMDTAINLLETAFDDPYAAVL